MNSARGRTSPVTCARCLSGPDLLQNDVFGSELGRGDSTRISMKIGGLTPKMLISALDAVTSCGFAAGHYGGHRFTLRHARGGKAQDRG
jgi:hypothetical protein